MLFHLHRVEVVESKLRDTGDADREFTAKVSLLGLEVDSFINLLGRKNIVSYCDVVNKDTFKLVGLRAQNFVLLEGLKIVHGEIADNRLVASTMGGLLSLLKRELGHSSDCFLGRSLRV